MDRMERRRSRFSHAACWIAMFLAAWSGTLLVGPEEVFAEDAAGRLRQKVEQLARVRERIDLQRRQAIYLQQRLGEQREQLVREIRSESRRLGTVTFDQALPHPRIDFTLRLVGRIDRYRSQLQERIDVFNTGCAELLFLYTQAEDELKLMETLPGGVEKGLPGEIDKALARYASLARKLSIRAGEGDRSRDQVIWEKAVLSQGAGTGTGS